MAEETALQTDEPVKTAEPVAPKEEEHHEDPTTISEYMESLLVTVLLALFGTSFIVQAFKIPSASMEGTLLIGDHLLVNKFIFGGSGAWYEKLLPYRALERGDIIVFKYPYADHQHFVKRVIGLPGDRLKLVDQQMYVNGKPLNEPYVVHDPLANTNSYDPFNTSFPPRRDQMISPQVIEESGWRKTLRNYVQGDELVVPPGKIFAMGDNRDHSSDSR
jgi:signal peptidase I